MKRCSCLGTRLPPEIRELRPLLRKPSSAVSTVSSSYVTTGSRLDFWLHALTSALSDMG